MPARTPASGKPFGAGVRKDTGQEYRCYDEVAVDEPVGDDVTAGPLDDNPEGRL